MIPVLVTYCSVTNHPKTQWHKTASILFCLLVQWLRNSNRAQHRRLVFASQWWGGLNRNSKGWGCYASGSFSHMSGTGLRNDCQPQHLHIASPRDLVFLQYGGWIPSNDIRRANIPREPGGSYMALYDLALGVTQLYFYRVALVTAPPRSNPRGPTYQWKECQRIWRPRFWNHQRLFSTNQHAETKQLVAWLFRFVPLANLKL